MIVAEGVSVPNPDLSGLRRAVQLRARCGDAAVAASRRLGIPVSPVQANVAFDAMVDLIREHDQEDVAQQAAGKANTVQSAPGHLFGSDAHMIHGVHHKVGECTWPETQCTGHPPRPDSAP